MAEALFWPAVFGYGEAAIAYVSPRYARLGTWGVRLGWLAQTALLAVQAARVDGFPWSTWAGSLNLFVWLVVGTYLIWGCRPRYRLLGLAVMPLAALLFVVSRVGGGTAAGERSHYGNLFLMLHVGLVLAAFAGFTLAAALAALYVIEERRLQRHAPDILSSTAALARRARGADDKDDRDLAPGAHGRSRRGPDPAPSGRRALRRLDDRRGRDLARLRRVPCSPRHAAARPPTWRCSASRS